MDGCDLDALRARVVDDPALRGRLLAARERSVFVLQVVDVARAEGMDLSPEDVDEALRAAFREHLERWV